VSNTHGGWRPDEQLGQLPPEYEPVHHEPRLRPDPRRTRPRSQQPPQPQLPPAQWQQPAQRQYPRAPGWQPGPPQRAGYDEDPRHIQGYPDQYDDGHEAGDGFMPGFGDGANGTNGAPSGYDSASGYEGAEHPGWDAQDDWVEPGGGTGRRQSRAEAKAAKRGRRRGIRVLAPWIAVLVILTPIAVGGYYAYSFYQSKYHPADFTGAGSGSALVQVHAGDTATSLAPELVSLGVVASSRAFVLAAEHSTSTQGLVPGFFQMHKHMQASLAYATLLNPANVVQVNVTIPEGWRASQIIARLVAKDPHITAADYQQALKNPNLGLPAYAKGNAEGYLFPSTFQILPNATALSVLQQMVKLYNQEAASVNLEQQAARVHLSPAQVVVVASLLQAEGGKLSDYPKIARVIYNRLAQGMKLQFDSTVLYGLNTYGIRASDTQLQSNSPYNTYKFPGLPPGPIDSPGNAAIQAALHPATGTWLYFVTVDPNTGLTKYATTYAGFQQLQQELQQNLNKG
jgi:uncharacterized YceG family protein